MKIFLFVSAVTLGVLATGGCTRAVVPDEANAELKPLRKETDHLSREADLFRKDNFDPLFARWLDGQQLIQQRVVDNLQTDLSHTNRAVEVESQLNDLRYMQSRIKEEIAYLRSLPEDDGRRINVKEFGAAGDGVTDDGVAIADALAAASTTSVHTVFFPKGKYFVGSAGASKDSSYHLRLKSFQDLLLKGEDGTEFIFGVPTRGGIEILGCNNVRLENLSITYRPLPYTLGTVSDVVADGYILSVKNGFPDPTASYFRGNDFKGLTRFYSAELIPDDVRPQFSNAAGHLSNLKARKMPDGSFLIQTESTVSDGIKGLNACLQARMNGCMAVTIAHSKRCRLDKVRVFASPGMAFLSNGSDMTFINNCEVGPDPELATFASSNADGIYIRDALMGGLISNNSIRYNGDDFFNVHNYTRPAFKIEGNVVFVKFWNEKILKPGHRLGWIFASIGEKHVSGEAFIEQVEKFDDQYKVTCDRELPQLVTSDALKKNPSLRPDYLCIMELQFHGGVVENNTFRHGLSRILLGGRNWLFLNNVIEDSLSHSELFHIGPRLLGFSGGEGIQLRNVLLEGNQLTCRSKTVFNFESTVNPVLKKSDPLATSHIDIKNNDLLLTGGNGNSPVFSVSDTSMVTISGNRIMNHTNSDITAFDVRDCEDAVVDENVVESHGALN